MVVGAAADRSPGAKCFGFPGCGKMGTDSNRVKTKLDGSQSERKLSVLLRLKGCLSD